MGQLSLKGSTAAGKQRFEAGRLVPRLLVHGRARGGTGAAR